MDMLFQSHLLFIICPSKNLKKKRKMLMLLSVLGRSSNTKFRNALNQVNTREYCVEVHDKVNVHVE